MSDTSTLSVGTYVQCAKCGKWTAKHGVHTCTPIVKPAPSVPRGVDQSALNSQENGNG